jgi:type IV secretion system protein TrbE
MRALHVAHLGVARRADAALFDNVDDTLTVNRLQVFDFEAMRAYPVLLEPLLFYVLHRVTARIWSRRKRPR